MTTTLYGPRVPSNTHINVNETVEGEPIERRIERIMNNSEPITDGAPTIYTDRKDGVIAEYDIRTDRFELAIEMTDKITKQALAKREEFHKPPEPPTGPQTSGEPAK